MNELTSLTFIASKGSQYFFSSPTDSVPYFIRMPPKDGREIRVCYDDAGTDMPVDTLLIDDITFPPNIDDFIHMKKIRDWWLKEAIKNRRPARVIKKARDTKEKKKSTTKKKSKKRQLVFTGKGHKHIYMAEIIDIKGRRVWHTWDAVSPVETSTEVRRHMMALARVDKSDGGEFKLYGPYPVDNFSR